MRLEEELVETCDLQTVAAAAMEDTVPSSSSSGGTIGCRSSVRTSRTGSVCRIPEMLLGNLA